VLSTWETPSGSVKPGTTLTSFVPKPTPQRRCNYHCALPTPHQGGLCAILLVGAEGLGSSIIDSMVCSI
jgi:hypothetical protein